MKMNKKKITTACVCVALVAAVGVGGTLAYLTKQTESKTNNFTFASDALNAMLTEPAWDGIVAYDEDGTGIYGYTGGGDAIYGYTDGDISKDPITVKASANESTVPIKDGTTEKIYGKEQAKNLIPGAVVQKNPMITNTGDISEWVAAKVTLVYAEGTADAGEPLGTSEIAAVYDAVEINFNADGGVDSKWNRVKGEKTDGVQVFYYNEVLAAGSATDALFTTVTIKSTATNDDIKDLENFGGFAIKVEGFAAQGDLADNYAGFNAWGLSDGNVHFVSDN